MTRVPYKQRICNQCGKGEMVRPSVAHRPYCSRECYAESMRLPGTNDSRRDPVKRRASNRAYKARNREALAARQREYYRRTRDERMAKAKEYMDNNPEVRRAIRFANGSNKRAREYGAQGHLYGRDVRKLIGPCVYCGDEERTTWDHVVPLSKGGANHVSNLVPACHPCNWSKGSRTPQEWRPSDWPEAQQVLRRVDGVGS